ncbi:TonB-dependent receptor [Natronoflexus pectinivorans]|uniref:Outer membrane receptor for ferrienterochelin and colicin n=1 Tax=Natronoflexus pectinivorans TaxID=682526 RepID=A0A4R2GJK8_9BACT|nr:TonB-dependent receptor [Natronoflexus pectinivorans]TCO08737.1 outer membrane receptor for ferrienterochelin and colicin [Natronoflexus pectinivorans]
MKSIFLLLIFSVSISVQAQQYVSGKVFDKSNGRNEAIAGANLHWSGTSTGTSTDHNGFFSIPFKTDNGQLVVSFVGLKPDTVRISSPAENLELFLTDETELDEVIIAARQPGTHISRLNPITTVNITSAELCKAACCSLAESFETNASVDVAYTDAATGARQIQLLGLSGTYVQMLTENMPNSRGLSNSFGLDFVPGPWMESIQVSKGAASVTNGYESLTGQINVQYKTPATSERLFVNGFTSSSGRFESNVNGYFDLNNRWSTAILAHASTDSQKNDHTDNNFLDEPLTTRYVFLNRYEFRPSPNIFTQFGIKILDEERTGGQMDFNRNTSPFSQDAYGITVDSRNFQGFFKTGYIFPGNEEQSVAIVTNFTHYDHESMYGRRFYDATQNYFAGNLIFSSYFTDAERHRYTTGISYMYDELRESLYGDINSDAIPHGNRIEQVGGAYFQYTYTLPERLTLLTGFRGDHHNMYGTFFTPRVHIRYTPHENYVIRLSGGRGYRTPNTLAENNPILASSRAIYIADAITQEKGWNYGINLTNYINIGLREITLNLEYYRTEFSNQLVMDLDRAYNEVHFYNLDGKSYSNVFQIEAFTEIFRGLDMVAAWRVNDVKITTNETLQRKALQSKYRGMLNFSYATPLPRWQLDFTTQFNGPGRIPEQNPHVNHEHMNMTDRFGSYQIYNAQITRYFRNWDFYLGAENIGNFKQHNPIVDPQNPFGDNFDSSLVWGPLMGRKFYFGFRYRINRDA